MQDSTNKNEGNDVESKEEVILHKSESNINYKLLISNLTAEIVESREANGDIFIPTFIEYQSKQFSVIRVCDEAFKDSSIESLSFSKESKVQTIGNFAFENSKIHKLFIPKSLEKLSGKWLQGAKELDEIQIDEENSYFTNESGFLIYTTKETNENENKSLQDILFAPKNFEGQFEIPEKVTHIGRFAFCQRPGLISVNSESSYPKVIKSFCFYQCENLRKITLKGQSELLLGGCCFSQAKNLLSVEISFKSITIGKNCFADCPSLNSVNLNADDKVTIGSCAFKGCSSLENILIFKASFIKIGDECFSDAANLKSATFVGNSIVLGDDIIKNCPLLSYITIESGEDISISSRTFCKCNLNHIKIVTSSKLRLNDFCFISKNLDNIELAFQSISFEKNCFSECSSLSMITLQSENEIQIFNEFFKDCKKLKKLFLASKSSIVIHDNFMNESKTLESVELSGSKIIIGQSCFNNCQSLSHFSIIKAGEIELKENQFINCNNLNTISIQASCINIKEKQICNCEYLKCIKIESNSNIHLKTNCFSGFVNLKKVFISGKNVIIEESCFKNCSNLKKIHFHEIENMAFESSVFFNCTRLKEVKFNADSQLIFGRDCFKGSSIEKVLFESKFVRLEENCFEDHILNKSTITSVNIVSEKVKIGDSCFSSSDLLKEFTISSAKEIEIGKNAFEKCNGLESIKFSAEDKIKILDSCFSKCQKLKSFSVSSAKNALIGKAAFENCCNLESVLMKVENKMILHDNCFFNAEKLENFQFSCNEALFGSYCFYSCSSLKNFINQNTDKILFSRQTFDCCDNLRNVEITTRSEFQAGDYCFDRLMNLQEVIISSPKVKIGDFCFNSCTSLVTLSFPNVEEFTYYNSYLLDCYNVNVEISQKAKKREIKSEKLEINKSYIDS